MSFLSQRALIVAGATVASGAMILTSLAVTASASPGDGRTPTSAVDDSRPSAAVSVQVPTSTPKGTAGSGDDSPGHEAGEHAGTGTHTDDSAGSNSRDDESRDDHAEHASHD
jgi:hypothetical protein